MTTTSSTSEVDNVLVPYNGTGKTPTKIYVPFNDTAKSAIKCYAGVNGEAKLVFPKNTPDPRPLYQFTIQATTVPQGATYILFTNKWQKPIYICNITKRQCTSVKPGNLGALDVSTGDTITVQEIEHQTFCNWYAGYSSGFLVYSAYSDMIGGWGKSGGVGFTEFPPIEAFTEDAEGTIAGNNFFYNFFLSSPAISYTPSMPDGSKITTVKGNNHFYGMYERSGAKVLPDKLLNLVNLTAVNNGFMSSFNNMGDLTTIIQGKLCTKNITSAGSDYLTYFNGSPDTPPFTNTGALTRTSVGSTDFINNVGPTQVVYKDVSSSWTTIAKGANMRFRAS